MKTSRKNVTEGLHVCPDCGKSHLLEVVNGLEKSLTATDKKAGNTKALHVPPFMIARCGLSGESRTFFLIDEAGELYEKEGIKHDNETVLKAVAKKAAADKRLRGVNEVIMVNNTRFEAVNKKTGKKLETDAITVTRVFLDGVGMAKRRAATGEMPTDKEVAAAKITEGIVLRIVPGKEGRQLEEIARANGYGYVVDEQLKEIGTFFDAYFPAKLEATFPAELIETIKKQIGEGGEPELKPRRPSLWN